MKKILLLFLSVLTFISCSDEIPEEKVSLKSGRTVLAYLISNNSSTNLDSYLKQNLVDMYSGLTQTTDSCTLIVYYRPYDNDNSGLTGPCLLQFNSDGKGNINNKKCLQDADLTPAKVIGEAFCSPYTDKNHNASVTIKVAFLSNTPCSNTSLTASIPTTSIPIIIGIAPKNSTPTPLLKYFFIPS